MLRNVEIKDIHNMREGYNVTWVTRKINKIVISGYYGLKNILYRIASSITTSCS